MKKIYCIALAVVLGLTAVSCYEEKNALEGDASGEKIGISEVSIESPVTKADDSCVSSGIIEGNGFSLEVIGTKKPMESEMMTKAVEAATTASTLQESGFWIDGYLGEEITGKAGYNGESLHFIGNDNGGAEVSYDGGWSIEGTPQWRTKINHYFWAYSPEVSNEEQSTTSMSFNYNDNTLSKDLVLAYAKKYWDCDKDGTLDLTFNHAVAAVDIEQNVTLWRKTESGEEVEVKASDTTPRLQINDVTIKAISEGTCTADPTFSWTTGLSINSKDASTTSFVIPQGVKTSSTSTNTALAVFSVTDTQSQITQYFEIPLPGFDEWEAGNYYNYSITGKIVAPYLPEGQEGYNTHFTGSNLDQLVKPFNTIDLTSVKKISFVWDCLPDCLAAGARVYIALSKKPIQTTYTKDNKGNLVYAVNGQKGTDSDDYSMNNFNSVFPTDLDSYSPDPAREDRLFFALETTADGYNIYQVDAEVANPDPAWAAAKMQFITRDSEEPNNREKWVIGDNVSFETTYPQSTFDTKSILVSGIDVSSLKGEYEIYIGYRGGRNSICTWVISNMSFFVDEYGL